MGQDVMEWWNIRKPFTDKTGEKHTLYFIGKEKNAKLMIASKGTEIDKLRKIQLAQTIVQGLEVLTRASAGREPEKKSRDITHEINSLSLLLIDIGGASDDYELPKTANWSYTPGTNKSAKVDSLSSKTSKEGKDRTDRTYPNGFKLIETYSLTNASKGHWVRMHLITHHVGGDNKEQNLIPAPHNINQGGQAKHFEGSLINLLGKQDDTTKKPNVIWIEVSVTSFHPASSGTPTYGNTDFASGLKMRAGVHFYKGGSWAKDSKARVSEDITIPLPNFSGGATKYSLSSAPRDKIRDITGCGKGFAAHILLERINGSYISPSDFETRMIDYYRLQGIKLTRISLDNVKKVKDAIDGDIIDL